MSIGRGQLASRWFALFASVLIMMTTSRGNAETESGLLLPSSHRLSKKDRLKTTSDDKSERVKPTKPKAPIAKVPSESRSGKIFELLGGGAYMEGYKGFIGQSGLFIGPDLVMEAGLFLGQKAKISTYLDGFVQGKFFVGDFFFVSLGGGVSRIVTTHEEKLDPESDTWKETGTKIRLHLGLGPQFTFGVMTMGLQAHGGYGIVMGEVENDLPESNQTAIDQAKDKETIASGLNYGASLFIGLAL